MRRMGRMAGLGLVCIAAGLCCIDGLGVAAGDEALDYGRVASSVVSVLATETREQIVHLNGATTPVLVTTRVPRPTLSPQNHLVGIQTCGNIGGPAGCLICIDPNLTGQQEAPPAQPARFQWGVCPFLIDENGHATCCDCT